MTEKEAKLPKLRIADESDPAVMGVWDVNEFLNERGDTCPICKASDWSVFGDSTTETKPTLVRFTQHSQTTKSEISGALFYLPIECVNCGYLRLHSIKRLLTWKSKKEKK